MIFWMLNWIGMLAVSVPHNLCISTSSHLLIFSNTRSGLALESLITLLTPRFLPFFMILWIISAFPASFLPPFSHTHQQHKPTANVSVCLLPIPVLPRIFHYGYAMPFYGVSRAVRTIVFGTKNSGTSLLLSFPFHGTHPLLTSCNSRTGLLHPAGVGGHLVRVATGDPAVRKGEGGDSVEETGGG
jgi:Protein of unknown function (DUF3533)